MGRKAEFTDQQIIDAGIIIETEGKLVSPFAIRNRLDGGSSERIKKVWEKYVAQKEVVVDEKVEEIDLPSEILDKLEKNQQTAKLQLEKLALESYRVAQQVAEKRVKSTIEDYQSKIAAFEESENQASLAIDSSDRKIDQLESTLDSLSTKNEKLLAENSKLQGSLDTLVERSLKLEEKEKQYEKLQRDFGKLEGKLESLQKR
ncbi:MULTISPECIES: DNA-binding protein [Aliiglaciecola]|uniref:DNA-binding protein n=1 Tax=Aliiglaciecola TaxID=1406885 RepID=UPI001C09C14C|nr:MULTISPECIES: DNA-binding protein [Aliiglaciecola]MBU2878734.1 DNA-binding protein [Aliiglaciecola lipolytica]MDO6711369.1 DNA-binding protein [Aliiglaciecola sp. 2_MG-2023]MDO6752182.1 DNA-binding protein [Aliiglaciecola sp. 1_MG-2023]